MVVTPVVLAISLLLVLLFLYRLLRHLAAMREVRLLYLVATVLSVVVVLAEGEGWLLPGLVRSLLYASLVLAWGYILYDFAERLLLGRIARRGGFPVSRLVRDILRAVALIAMCLLVINRVFGVPLSSLVISSTIVSAVIGLALQDLLRNVVAGIALQTERTYSPDDWIEVDGQIGKVLDMNWRATRLVTVDNTRMIVPNATLAQARINNFHLDSPLQALHVQIPLSPQHPPSLVKETLVQAALAAEGVLSEPRPGVRLIAYGEYSVTYDIKFWMDGFERYIETRDAVMTNAWYFLRRAGMRQPTPLREIYLHEAAPALPADERNAEIERMLTTLRRVEIFAVLSEEELQRLASRIEAQIYCAGEVLVRQGDTDNALFAIHSGMVRVEVQDASANGPIVVNRLGPGEVFGEAALLTGAPRRATIIAEQDTETLVVKREAIAPLLAGNASLPELLGTSLERRMAQTEQALLASRSSALQNGTSENERSLVGVIRSLFGLG
jgi:small-conductance mechanosensitive channel/CRP-like cAMP-binding protein